MSEKALRKAARLRIPQQMPDLETKLVMMLMADRADDNGRFASLDEDEFHAAMTEELNAIMARLGGDQFIRAWVDNARVSRVIAALKDYEDQR